MKSINNRRDLSLENKIEILKKYDALSNISKRTPLLLNFLISQ